MPDLKRNGVPESPTESTCCSSPGEQWVDVPVPVPCFKPIMIGWNDLSALYDVADRPMHVRLALRFCERACVPLSFLGLQMIVGMLSLMHRCNFSDADVISVMSHACACLPAVFRVLHSADSNELAHIACLQCYISHTLIIDEPCRITYWQKFVFQSSDIKALDSATIKLMKIQDFYLRVHDSLMAEIREFLQSGLQLTDDCQFQ